jgi:hypothetical protein
MPGRIRGLVYPQGTVQAVDAFNVDDYTRGEGLLQTTKIPKQKYPNHPFAAEIQGSSECQDLTW